ncbi:related to Peroxisomal biogenesis factor 3 [Zygosaccharomyces bailii ISA1307]|nr:related to Peroxisomal biogenesis factor 3 [Zygosaccharomyces bailii ISA1307]
MTGISKGRGLVRRHKGKIVFSLAVFSSLIAAGSVCLWMMKRWLYKQQMKLTEQHFIGEQIRRRFTQTQEDSLYALYELIPVFALVVGRNLDLEELVIALRDKKQHKLDNRTSEDGVSSGISTSVTSSGNLDASRGEVRSKAELWNELKSKSLVKLVTVAYTISSLLLLTRLQLNILTRREYLETAVKMAVEKEEKEECLASWWSLFWCEPSGSAAGSAASGTGATAPNKTSYINEQAFLSLSWWLLNRGWLEYETAAQEAVACEFGTSSPRDTLSLEEFGNRLTNVFVYINEKLLKNSQLNQVLLPPNHLELFVLQQTLDPEALGVVQRDSTVLSQLLNETSQCIASSASSIVLESMINECFQYIMGQVEASTSKKKRTGQGYQLAVFSISCKDCCNSVLKSGVVSMDNELLARLDACPQLDDLSASVYSNFG